MSAVEDHRFVRAEDVRGELGDGWRWLCSCGDRGRVQYQSPNCCPFDHARHVDKIVEKRLHQAGVHRGPARRPGRRRARGA